MSNTIPQNKTVDNAPQVSAVGKCLNCGARLTLCGTPFSLEVTCRKCLRINIYEESQQPSRLK